MYLEIHMATIEFDIYLKKVTFFVTRNLQSWTKVYWSESYKLLLFKMMYRLFEKL